MKFIKHKFTFIKKIIYSKNLYSCTIYAWYPLNSHIKCFRAHTCACIFGLCACLWIASANQNAEQGSPLSAHWDSRNSKCSEASVLVLRHFDVIVKSCLISPPPTLSLPPWCPTSFSTHSPVLSVSSVPHTVSPFPCSQSLLPSLYSLLSEAGHVSRGVPYLGDEASVHLQRSPQWRV